MPVILLACLMLESVFGLNVCLPVADVFEIGSNGDDRASGLSSSIHSKIVRRTLLIRSRISFGECSIMNFWSVRG